MQYQSEMLVCVETAQCYRQVFMVKEVSEVFGLL